MGMVQLTPSPLLVDPRDQGPEELAHVKRPVRVDDCCWTLCRVGDEMGYQHVLCDLRFTISSTFRTEIFYDFFFILFVTAVAREPGKGEKGEKEKEKKKGGKVE